MKPGKLSSDLNAPLATFLKNYPFANARAITKCFKISPTIVNDIFRDLGLRKFSRRWVSHQFMAARKLA
jgi:hypothetical protein